MDRLTLAAIALAVTATAACAASFKDRRTPSGDFCSDMVIIPAGQEPDREYHRLQPIKSDISAKTEAERLESLRKAACLVGADSVIEAVNEEVRADNAQYATVSSGTAVIWLRPHSGEVKPLTILTKKPAPAPEPTAEPAPTTDVAASAAPSAKPVAGKGPKAGTKTATDPTKKQ